MQKRESAQLTRWLLHSGHDSQIQFVVRASGVPDLDQPLQLLEYSIQRMPVLLHREVSKPTKWAHRQLMVQCCKLDRSDVTLISTRDRMILVVARE